jgi:predicted GIY-YIG superfamily endonuclease
MAFWVYILKCSDGSYYTGHTDNLESRIAQHHEGKIAGYTHDKQPLTLMLTQDFPTRAEALSAEQQIKGWSRAKKQALIEKDWVKLSLLAKSYASSGSTSESTCMYFRRSTADCMQSETPPRVPRTVGSETKNTKQIGSPT